MAIDPQDLVEFAYTLHKQSNSEIQFRTIANRAYYGAFLTARDHANITNSSGSIHKEVIDYYRNRNIGKISNNLDTLKRLRQKADYNLHENITISDSKTSCRVAKTILKEVEKLK